MERIQNLRKLAVKLDVSGTAEVLSNAKLYQGGFGFVQLQCYVPVTQAARGKPLCTVHRAVTDDKGQRKIFNQEKFNMLYVDTVPLDGNAYLLFESPMPKPFTDTAGELELVFNYAEADPDGKVSARLVSNVYRATVAEGGADGGEIELSMNSQEAAQINANTFRLDSLERRLSVKTLIDFTVDEEGLEGVKYYSDGTTANVRYPAGGGNPAVKTDFLRILNFTEESFAAVTNASGVITGYELGFGSAQTGYGDSRYFAALDRSDSKTYEAGGETTASARQGYSQEAEPFFKGSDGSILLYSVAEPYAGRLVLLGGSAFSGEFVTGITFSKTEPQLTVAFVNGERESVPLTGAVVDDDYTHTDNNYTSGEKTKLGGIEAGAEANPTQVSELANDAKYQTETEVDTKIAAMVDSAPETLNTLNELAAALGDDPNFAATVSAMIGTKASQTQVDALEARNTVTNVGYNAATYDLTTEYRTGSASTVRLPFQNVAYDENYTHTDENFTSAEKTKLGTLSKTTIKYNSAEKSTVRFTVSGDELSIMIT